MIFANDLHVAVRGQIARNALKGPAVVVRDEHVWPEIVTAVPIGRNVRGRGIEMRRINPRDPVEMIRRQPRQVLSDLGEVHAAILADLDIAIVGSGPDDAGQDRRFGDRDDGAVGDDAVVLRELGDVAGHTHQRHLVAIDLLAQIGARQPRVAAVVRLEQAVAA